VTAAELQRLERLLGMLGSDFDGEIINAARLANRLIREAKVSWAQILHPPASPAPTAATQRRSWRTVARECVERELEITGWEREFLSSVLRQQRTWPSVKQAQILKRLAERLHIEGW
jgi:hypothetical protein